MKRFAKGLLAAALAVALIGSLALSASTAEAQGGRSWVGAGALIGACSTTDYTSVAAQALNMTPTELRVALAGGASLVRIAAQRGVDIATVQEALRAARLAEVDRALADGLITSAQADQLKELLNNPPSATGGRGMRMPIQRVNLLAGVSARNTVKAYAVAAEALGIPCPELVKAVQAGQSIAQVAVARGVSLQALVDALSKAYSDALAKDVQEGLVAPARAQTLEAQIINSVLRVISRPHGQPGRPHLPRIGQSGIRFDGVLPTDVFDLLGIQGRGMPSELISGRD
ncbi:MAG: hypothetical protein SNJ58_03775 [Aggregatilineales bacterium]